MGKHTLVRVRKRKYESGDIHPAAYPCGSGMQRESATCAVALRQDHGITSDGVSEKTFGYFCDEWLQTRKYSWKESTYIKYSNTLQRHIKPRLGNLKPLELRSETIALFSQALFDEEGLSIQTVKGILIQLNSILKYTSRYFPDSFPFIEVIYPKEIHREMSVMNLEDQKRLVRLLIQNLDPCTFGILLALQTGMRIGEICALKWKNIDLSNGTISITGTMQRLKNLEQQDQKTKVVVTAPKSSHSARVIPMCDQTAALCERMKNQNPEAYVLTGTEKFMEPRTLQYRLKKYTQECGLTDVHFHTLRHSFATRCVEVGFEIKSLSEILGHSSTKITLDRYVHSSLELKRSNMHKLDALNIQ